MWNCWACSKHNVAMQTTVEFASNSTANIRLSKRPSFLLMTSKNFITKSKNVSAKKLCGGVVALKIPRNLTCDSWICNVVGCKTQISIELGCSPERFTWKVGREQCCKSQLIKTTNQGKDVPVGRLLRRLTLVGFIYVPVRSHKDVSNRSDVLTHQLQRHDDVSAWSRMFKLVTKMGQFLLCTI